MIQRKQFFRNIYNWVDFFVAFFCFFFLDKWSFDLEKDLKNLRWIQRNFSSFFGVLVFFPYSWWILVYVKQFYGCFFSISTDPLRIWWTNTWMNSLFTGLKAIHVGWVQLKKSSLTHLLLFEISDIISSISSCLVFYVQKVFFSVHIINNQINVARF